LGWPMNRGLGRNRTCRFGTSKCSVIVGVALAGTLALLLWHASRHTFLTDDAFISFRYAENLAGGNGLVFNPGLERVEGYSNFLLVIILAAFRTAGIRPEISAHIVSISATILLWGLVVWFVERSSAKWPRWIVVVPALWLAATRSIAVWSTGGLETRLFEALVVAGVFSLVVEIRERQPPRSLLPVTLLALATLTRPDGFLIAVGVLVTAGATLHRQRRLRKWLVLRQAVAFGAIVGTHYLFRRIYYGEWLPNTYYAKAHQWWSMGLKFETAFAIEYAVYLWLPLLVLGIAHHRRTKTLWIPWIFAGAVVPYLIYVASIGGDFFEYRMLDITFPFAFALMADGLVELQYRPLCRPLVAPCAALVLLGLVDLPQTLHQISNREPPRGLIGMHTLPGLDALAALHRSLRAEMKEHWVSRPQEHFDGIRPWIVQGKQLRRLVDGGLMRSDTRIALSDAGAIPYYSQLTTIDLIGLNDASIARGPGTPNGQRKMAHEHFATPGYLRERKVDLMAIDFNNLLFREGEVDGSRLAAVCQRGGPWGDCVGAYVGDGIVLLAYAPLGFEYVARRLPELKLRQLDGPAAIEAVLARAERQGAP